MTRLSKLLLVAFCTSVLPAGATVADTMLFTNGAWRVDGVEDLAMPPAAFGSITVSVNKTNLGSFTRLKVYFTTTNGISQVFNIGGNGSLQPFLPGGAPGVEARLSSYWDCELAGYLDMGITDLAIETKKKGRDVWLYMTGNLSNFNSMGGRKLKLMFPEPEADSTRVFVDYVLFATRKLCVDKLKQDTHEGFLVARLVGTYFDADNHDCDLARVVGITDINCFPYTGCIRRTKDFCRDVTKTAGDMFTNKVYRIGGTHLMLSHGDDYPAPYPAVRIEFIKPKPAQTRAQGFSLPATDVTDRNVEFWGSWMNVKNTYRAKARIYRMRLKVEAIPLGPRSCENLE
jgi:hypothetical protein